MARYILAILFMTAISGCTPPSVEKQAAPDLEKGDYLSVVKQYREALAQDPGNIELKTKLKQHELNAAQYYYHLGMDMLLNNDYDGAIGAFQKGLFAMPENEKLLQALQVALSRKEASELYREAWANYQAGNMPYALQLSYNALERYPDHEDAKRLIALIEEKSNKQDDDLISSGEPITVNFKDSDIRNAFGFVAKSFSINVVFDESIKDQRITLYASNVTLRQALDLMTRASGTFYKAIAKNTIVVAIDTDEKRDQYEDYVVQTFFLRNIKAAKMADIIKGIIPVKRLVVNEHMNSIMVRDRKSVIEVVEKIVLVVDRKPAELILEVEILEVNRSKVDQLGLDYGRLVTASYGSYSPATSTFAETLRNATITIPNTTFSYFKQDVDANTLANPKIRVISGKEAKIHIGDRVPLRSATIQDATGQTRTTFEYTDIGIRLKVEPQINYDNSVIVKLNLEVSSLGQDLGTKDEPAYTIGTRNAETYMLLRDGETAILGGLIRDEDRKNKIKVPGLGEIPAVGQLFTYNDDSGGKTDVLLTITPKLVRSWELPPENLRQFYSGTENSYSTTPMSPTGNDTALPPSMGPQYVRPNANNGMSQNGTSQNGPSQTRSSNNESNENQQTSLSGDNKSNKGGANNNRNVPQVSFSSNLYRVKENESFEIDIRLGNIGDSGVIQGEILVNDSLLSYMEYVKVDPRVESIQVNYDKGTIRFDVKLKPGDSVTNDMVLFKLRFTATKKGVSYLTYRDVSAIDGNGQQYDVQMKSSRIVIQK